jgi:hypothetical protein
VSRPRVLLSRRRLLNHTSTEPRVYRTTRLLNHASTEPHVCHGRPSAPQPHILTQDELNDLVRDLELSKSTAELLRSRLKQRNFLEKMSKFLRFAVVISSWCLSSERKMTLCSAMM